MRHARRDRLLSLALVAPSCLLLLLFVYGFIGWSGWISMTDWEGISPELKFVGFEQYERLLHHDRFQRDLVNTGVFTLLFLAGNLFLGLLLAVLLDRKLRGESFFRSLFLFPMSVSFVVTGTIWVWVFNPQSGLNRIFAALGFDVSDWGWITDPKMALTCVALAAIWQMAGFTMAQYLAGLRGIAMEQREAARIDGANEAQVFRHVLLPQLWPITVGAIVVLGHISLKIFDLVYVMTQGGPARATDVPGIFMFEVTFANQFLARGAAIGVVMLLMVALLIVPYLVYARSMDAR
ncbi:MAG: sugar ABC transporter permease [Candidatus Alcyoniella australis]|nr:sugar ABC transporter permease [Candidatus Alcyoniella australis]